MLYIVCFMFIVKKWEMCIDSFNNNKISKGTADIFYKITQTINTCYQILTKPNMLLWKKAHKT